MISTLNRIKVRSDILEHLRTFERPFGSPSEIAYRLYKTEARGYAYRLVLRELHKLAEEKVLGYVNGYNQNVSIFWLKSRIVAPFDTEVPF